MLALIVLVGLSGHVESADPPDMVYDQNIYSYLFNKPRVNWGVYNKNSPPMRKDEMTKYTDGMAQFNHSIDAFVDWHCEPYINFLQSKRIQKYLSKTRITFSK